MISLRRSNERGHANHGWLDSFHTFSFADYYDEAHMGFSVLRVINEDRIEGGMGFSTHGHRDMEIISYVIDGAVEHKDSMGSNTIIQTGDVQRMSAGTGVRHSEYNHLKDKVTHFLQIWILPEKKGIQPSYDQKSFTADFQRNDLVLVASKSGEEGSITVNQDVRIYACHGKASGNKLLQNKGQRKFWLQVVKGSVQVEGETLHPGDGAGLENLSELNIQWAQNSEFLVFDLP